MALPPEQAAEAEALGAVAPSVPVSASVSVLWQMVKVPPLAAPQFAPCASSARAWRL